MGRYETAYFCAGCKKEVSYSTKMYSHGRCPLCGYKGPRAGTIMDTTEEPVYRPSLVESIAALFKKK